ncbi:hypothetical protein ACVIGB_000089 [Bradyrhizobium sp. USDA 4341]
MNNIKIGSFVHPELGIVAGVLVLGRTGTEVTGAYITVSNLGVPTVYGPLSERAVVLDEDLAEAFERIRKGPAAKSEWADKKLSEGLSYFGFFRRDEASTIVDLCMRAQSDDGRQADDETLSEIRRSFMKAMSPVVAAIDGEALKALRATAGFSRSDFAFYAPGEGGADREQRRIQRLQAASAYPMLAVAMARNLRTKLAIDGAKPLAEALIDGFGLRDGRPVFSKGVLRRIQSLDWPVPNGITPEWLAEKLGSLPPDWFPKNPEEWNAFLSSARGLGRTLPSVSGMPFPDLVAGCGGKWTDFRKRLAKAHTDTRPPENLDEEQRREWMRNPVVPDESFGALQNAVVELEHMIETFARLVVMPAAATLGGETKPYLGEPQRAAARHAAARLLFGGKNAAAIFETSRHFATQLEHIQQIAAGEPVRPAFKQVAEDGWAPLCNAVLAPNGVSIIPLTDPRELADEGRGLGGTSTLNEDGSHGLAHCVGGYSESCRKQGHHIMSFRLINQDGSFKRLSTIELLPISEGDREMKVKQHRGRRNGEPPADARDAWDWFRQAVRDTRVPLNFEGIRQYLIGLVSNWNDDVERMCGYKWREEGAIERALRAFDPYLGKGLRGLSVQRFLELPDIDAVGIEITPRRISVPA